MCSYGRWVLFVLVTDSNVGVRARRNCCVASARVSYRMRSVSLCLLSFLPYGNVLVSNQTGVRTYDVGDM